MTLDKIQGDDTGSNDIASDDNKSNLIDFVENNSTNSPGKDINEKITSLDVDLGKLRAELVSINGSVEQGLDRLGDTDTDLTAKVSETYKRLGEIDNAYKSLIEISTRIDNDIQRLNGDVSTVAVQSAEGLKNLEESNIAQSNAFTQKNQKVVSEIDKLVETSKLTNEMLNQKIQSATEGMKHIEKNVIAEVERLADITKNRTDVIQSSIESSKAKIIKLQSVDEAIIRRATTLEISSAELTAKSQNIESSLGQLKLSVSDLSTGLEALKDRTGSLEVLTAKHATFIGALQKTSVDIGERLNQLTDREKYHFNIFTSGFLLLLVVMAVIYFSQQSQFADIDTAVAERSEMLDKQIVNIQQGQASANALTNTSLAALETKVEKLNLTLQEEVKSEIASIEAKVETINDQVQSIEGRFNQSSSFSQIGDDNIIHGKGWVMNMPADNYLVQLAYVGSKDAMYEIARSYNFYLKDSLSHFEVDENGIKKYVLLSGNFPTERQAMNAIASMPGYIDMQAPLIRKVDAVQKYIADH